MKANELRIGNYTSFGVVYSIENDHFYTEKEDGISYKSAWADIQPISLTPEILVRCGFVEKEKYNREYERRFYSEKSDKDISSASNQHFFVIEKDGNMHYCIEEIAFGHDGYVFVDIKFLHQLQNLYFALTGTELEINL